MIPFLSGENKFVDIYNQTILKYGIYDTIVFSDILGHRKAFLI